tara:strand:+ start:556 stop:858 length:303 start_codon:yes stop_codon:yes gene_type:complete
MSKPVRNDEVITEWNRSRVAISHTGSLKSNGGELRSYGLLIGFTTPEGKKVALDYTAPAGHFHSQTTSCHVGQAKRASDVVLSPSVAQGLAQYQKACIPF